MATLIFSVLSLLRFPFTPDRLEKENMIRKDIAFGNGYPSNIVDNLIRFWLKMAGKIRLDALLSLYDLYDRC